MINFATLQGLTIPEGVVTQITDASGRVLWAVKSGGGPAVLQVEKITATTKVNGTVYNDEQFILLNIYPKTNGTVSVTYGGLTKTVTDTSGVEEPNAQEVYFGTYGGASDGVETPANGELTIDGDYYAFGCGEYAESASKVSLTVLCKCVTEIKSFGNATIIPENAFGYGLNGGCNITTVNIPDSILKIGGYAFHTCKLLHEAKIGKSVESIGVSAFASLEPGASKTIIMRGNTPPKLLKAESNDGEIYNNFGLVEGENAVLEKIIVPKGSSEAYKNDESWIASGYAAIVTEV